MNHHSSLHPFIYSFVCSFMHPCSCHGRLTGTATRFPASAKPSSQQTRRSPAMLLKPVPERRPTRCSILLPAFRGTAAARMCRTSSSSSSSWLQGRRQVVQVVQECCTVLRAGSAGWSLASCPVVPSHIVVLCVAFLRHTGAGVVDRYRSVLEFNMRNRPTEADVGQSLLCGPKQLHRARRQRRQR